VASRLPTAERRPAIARAALRLLGQGGLAALKTGALAREVGLTSGALFRHFPSLEAILAETARLARDRLEATLPAPGLAPREALATLLRERIALLRAEPGIAWLLSSEQAAGALPEEGRRLLEEAAARTRAALLDCLRQGAAAGLLRRDLPPEDLLPLVLGTVHTLAGTSGIRATAARAPDVERGIATLLRLLQSPAKDHTTPMDTTDTLLQPGTPVGRIATQHPLATRVFHRHQIDFCCGGGRSLEEACRARGLDPEAILAELRQELAAAGPVAETTRWDEAPVEDLIRHILVTYHEPLKEELPRLEAMARKVHEVHGEKDPERFRSLLQVFLALKDELDQHLLKEERILFPMIQAGQGATAGGPISVMEHEHDSAGAALRRLRELTGDYRVPEEACNTWRALWAGLEDLERALHEHIHLENNILFPRVLGR